MERAKATCSFDLPPAMSILVDRMDITFLGATRTVTGSSYLVSAGDRRIMVDCGLYQGRLALQEKNYTHPQVDWAEVDAILLTHAHIDHSGLIPRAVKLGFTGKIYTHAATIDLSEIMLKDSAEIHVQDAKWISRKRKRAGKDPVEPLFDEYDVVGALKQFESVKYDEPFEVCPGFRAEFRDSGHILGAASIAVDATENGLTRRIVFSGDIGHHQAPILREPHGFEEGDVVLIETTYGNRLHETPEDRWNVLRKIVNDSYREKGKILIPAFTVGRTQELLYILGEMMTKDEIPSLPIYLDSPMAISATKVHEKHPECFDAQTHDRIKRGENPFRPDTLVFSQTVEDSKAINRVRGSAIIIAGGGMCEGGRIVHHLKHHLYDRSSHLVFVGYQAEGTLGRVILKGKRKHIRLFGEQIAVNAQITAVGAFSAHADRDGLIDWLRNFSSPPKATFLVHGEEQASMDFGEHVREQLGYQAYLPRLNQQVRLENLDEIDIGKRAFVESRTPSSQDVNEIVARVSFMGHEFQDMVETYVGELGSRIKKAQSAGGEGHWRTQDVSEVLSHLSEAVGGDIDRLEELIASSKPPDDES